MGRPGQLSCTEALQNITELLVKKTKLRRNSLLKTRTYHKNAAVNSDKMP